MFSRFIERPVLAIVISLIITLLGVLAMTQLPMTQFPSVAPPEVNVTTEYTGANAETSVKAVITPLERAINGVPGMKYMSSDATNDGVSVVQVIFEVGTDPDVAAVNVQNRVAAVMAELPSEVIKNGIKIAKEENSMLMYLNIFSDNDQLDEKFLYNFADINVLAELKRIKGVGFADIMGAREYAMRIWLKPDRMLAYNISADEIVEKLQEQNVEAAPGKLGESSDKQGQALQYVLKYTGKYTSEAEYGNIPLRSSTSGELLRLKDVADIEFSTTYYDVVSKHNGRPSAAIMLKQLPGSNASEVIAGIKERMAELKQTRFASGMDYEVTYDVSRFLDASIHEVIKTLIEAFVLVALVVFLFLQDFRSTLIPAIAVPVALVGTFFFMQLFGFSINLITLFALVLAIGIVVDDSIVVVEAVHAKMEHEDLSPWEASKIAINEIGGAVVAITLVMTAVFVPVTFLSGPVGIFFRQFAVTMAIAILISAVNALTLSPALCALILKNNHGSHKTGLLNRFFSGFNSAYNRLEGRYQRLLKVIINRRVITFGVLAAFCVGIGVTSSLVPSGFIPNDDQGTFYASITTPAGSTLERTRTVVDQIQQISKRIPAIKSVSSLAGNNILSDGTGATFGTCLVNLKNWEERTESVDEVMDELAKQTHSIKDAKIEFFPPPAVPGYGNASGFELRLLDRTGSGDYKKMESVVRQFVQDLTSRPEIENAFTIFDASFPQYLLYVDTDKAAQKNVSVGKAMQTLQTLIGSEYATNFIRFGQMYKVMVQALPEYRAQLDDLLKLYVKNDEGEMVPFSAFMRVERVYGLEQATRYNMYPSAEINGQAAAGFSSGSAIKAVQEVAATKLPKGYGIDWAGISRDEVQSGNQAVYIFLICLVFVYLILSAQYESFLLPLPVILSLPTGIFGAFFFLWLTGLENNIYAQIAMVMLIGLLGKNAILIVEFANQRRSEGLSVIKAAMEGAVARLRPILMTSFAFIAGLIPLCIATGAGAVGNRTIGTAAAGGMLMGTLFGLVVVPGLYVVFASLANRLGRNRNRHPTHSTSTPANNILLQESLQ
ncbi:efflux RND transporter permease subunit [Spirosoma harenae]